ncbi:PREDICTED: uncharacterized protein LOC109471732 isoform X1 [Branchiostoma belcheri]|uniref:Uncharacterized protein LOC109471732 isoform X1 n=2 Tax=Branchiostoma belcheri TaxID=7741 RepID=A0A6P4ZAD2_BRABE|nr:PREDICTED: uncharacterized protein LOC109471732 isoform X1 [Branchiostoma belcheri]
MIVSDHINTATVPSEEARVPCHMIHPAAPQEMSAVQQVLMKLSTAGAAIAAWENELLTALVKRQLAASADGQTITCRTGGLPITLMKVTKARKPTSQVSASTGRRRTRDIATLRAIESGGDEQQQMSLELKSLGRQQLQDMLRDIDVGSITIPTGHLLSAQLDLGLNNSQRIKLRRWLKLHNVASESERRSRQLAKDHLQEHQVEAELLPLVTKGSRKGGNLVKLQPVARVTDVRGSIIDTLEKIAAEGHLTWHEGKIPASEIWIKVLGDHGGQLYKMGYQILNTVHPNAKTRVFSIFDGKDSRENLITATKTACTDVAGLQAFTWRSPDGRDRRLRVFAAADYALLSLWFGLSGPCGTYPCLWCEIQRTSIKLPQEERGEDRTPADRTTLTLEANHNAFMQEAGGDIRKAKSFRNVIAPSMLEVPINQVCLPALHMSLGVFQKLFKMMEKDLHSLDVLMAHHLSRAILPDPEVDRGEVLLHPDLYTLEGYLNAVEEATAIEEEVDDIKAEMEEMVDLMAWAMLQGQEECLIMLSLQLKHQKLQQKKEELEARAQEMREKAGTNITVGPLTALLDPVLQQFHVKRQAYHAQCFVGNHVHVMLKEAPIKQLTSIAVTKAEELMDDFDFPLALLTRTREIKEKYERAFWPFRFLSPRVLTHKTSVRRRHFLPR